jgi:hypothetical protein
MMKKRGTASNGRHPLARSCPYYSLAPVLLITRMVAAASKEGA